MCKNETFDRNARRPLLSLSGRAESCGVPSVDLEARSGRMKVECDGIWG